MIIELKSQNPLEIIKKAYEIAWANSPDPSTRNGCILINPAGQTIAGWNHFPLGMENKKIWLEDRTEKYSRVVHAEVSVITNAARLGISTNNSIVYGTWMSCSNCAKTMIDAGIKKIIAHKSPQEKALEAAKHRALLRGDCEWREDWVTDIEKALIYFKDSGIEFEEIEGFIGGIQALHDRQIWHP